MHRKAVFVALSTLLMFVMSGGVFPTVQAQSNDPAPAVQTDKRAYLPGSPVIASGSGWSNGEFVTLTYTEIATTDPQGTLAGPVSVDVLTDGNGNFLSTGAPSDTYTTPTSHNATVTVLLTATGKNANGNSVSVQSATFTNGVTVTTDENHYAVGLPMTISGAGFTPFFSVTVTVLLPNHTFEDPLTTTVNDDGTFSAVYTPTQVISGRYKITATDGLYTAETATTEADAINIDFKQCANRDNTLGDCHWINSILQSSNSRIVEGMSTLQRMIFDDIPVSTNNGVYRMQFHTDSLKAASHAYDFITTWETAIDATNEIVPPPFSTPVPLYPVLLKERTDEANALACGTAIPASLLPVCLALRKDTNPNVTYADLNPAVVELNDPVLGDHVSTRVAAYQDRYGIPLYTAAGKQHAVKFYSNAPIDAAFFALRNYDAQGNGNWELRWHSTGTPTQLMIEFGAHVAVGDNKIPGFEAIEYGLGRGAANISGGPYHVSVDLFDNNLDAKSDDISLGSQDNQLKGADILIPSVVPAVGSTLTGAVLNGKVEVGTTVHDTADIDTGSPDNLIPVGSTVTFKLFNNLTCTDPTLLNTYGPFPVPSGVQVAHVDSPSFTPTPGTYSYQVIFVSGNPAIVQSGIGPCEPFTVIAPATTLTLKSQTPPGPNVAAGSTVTIVVTETNTGNDPLTGVNVTGGGKCAIFTGGAATLAVGASTDFTCTFTATAGANAWSADGHGTDSLGNPVPATGEHAAGSVTGLTTSTTLTLVSQLPSPVAVGGTVTVIVRETNTGTTSLNLVNVTGGGKCATFGGGAATLLPGAFTDFTCTFIATAGANAWSADGHGTDQFGNPAPSAGEHAEGSVPGLTTSTTLTLVSQLPSPVAVGGTVTVIVRETNTGTTSLNLVNVTGGGKCATFGGGAATLLPGAFTDFTCTFIATAGANAWSADGHGTDQFGNPAPSAGEHAEGSVPGLTTSTTLTLVSQLPSPVAVGGTVTVIVRETNTGTTSLNLVNVTGGGKCATFGGGAATLLPGAFTDFTCTFIATAGANAWSADGHGTDQFGNPAPSAGEHAEGSVPGLTTSTTLTLVSQLPSPVAVGGTVTVIVRETNTGTTSLNLVNVTGGGKCATFGGGAATLLPGAFTDFTCTFIATAGANAWSADGHGTDQFGNPAPSAGEHAEGSVPGLTTSTTLTLVSQLPSPVAVGGTVTVIVRETNTGTTSLNLVNVTGGGKCATFGGGAATLLPGAFTDFTCTFIATAGANAWSADGHGTDQFGNPAPSAGEHAEGSVPGLTTSTTLTLVSQLPSPVAVGGTVTVIVRETNTGTTSLNLVNVTGGGKCATFGGGAATLLPGAFTDFTCTFIATAGANAWSADGHGTDQFGNPAPSAGEHAEGSVPGLTSSTTLALKSQTPPGASLEAGTLVTIVVTETNTGTTSLNLVNVTGGGKCATFGGGAGTLLPGASTDFSCTFTVTAGATNAWSADGHGTDQFGTPVPAAGEHAEGALRGVAPATVLTLKSVSPGLNVPIGTLIAVVVTETNTGNGLLTSVNVTGGGKCALFTGGATTLAPGASTDFVCTFLVTLGPNAWAANGHGTDELGNPAPATNEHQEGAVLGFDTHVQLTKLVNGGTPSASDPAFQFQLWTGLSATTPGTLLETKTTTPGVNNVLNFTSSLVPGAQYQMCELVVNGFTPDFNGFGSFNPNGNNPGYICFNFTANTTSTTLLITVNNTHQVGLALTIGFWKNHASCSSSNGNQEPVTDQVLQLFEPAGFTIGILTLHDTNPDPDVASDCLAVVNLLNKTTILGGKKMASDPLFNMAAQLVAYYLNVQNGASPCPEIANAAQALLVAHQFNGVTHTALTKAQADYANALNQLLDTYNNNNGCGALPTAPNPL